MDLVFTGRGADQAQLPEAAKLAQMSIYDQLQEALEEIVPVYG